ncbi:MAG: MOSC domain-containing protein [Epsilonproteobacteria bacterium]|nr:MOSC domain-containing protein [Campylobacterota bacterium]
MQQVGRVVSLFISDKELSRRVKQDYIEIDRGGIINDKFYDKDIDRSILITSIDSYKLAKNRDIDIKYGQLGENILIDYNPYHLPHGTQISIGEVILEISQHCTICKSLSKIDSKLPKLLKDDRGIFVKVIKSGFISQDDTVNIMELATA